MNFILIKFHRFFSAPWSLRRYNDINKIRLRWGIFIGETNEKRCVIIEKKKISAKDTFPQDPLIRIQTTERTLIEMEDKKQWEKTKKLFSWSDVQTAWVIRLKFVWARFHFYFAFVDWRNRPWFDFVPEASTIILIVIIIIF